MTRRDRLRVLLNEVKYKIEILDVIEERLLNMHRLVKNSMKEEILDDQCQRIQLEIDRLYNEIKLLQKYPTLEA